MDVALRFVFLLFHLAFIAALAFAALELLQYFILKNHRLQ